MAVDAHLPPAPAPRRAVIVLGMHRSGTSAVAGCLQRMGVDFGPRLMPATEANARGYYEHIDLVNVHDRLLLALGRSWDDTTPFPPDWWLDEAVTGRYRSEVLGVLGRDFPTAPLWGFKDPRLCRLLPWWEPIWEATRSQPLFVLVRRPPADVVASLTRREGFSAAKSYLLWLQHTLEAERHTRSHPRVLLDFDSFLDNSEAALSGVERALGEPWPAHPSSAVGRTDDSFVEPALARSSRAAVLPDSTLPWIVEVDQALQFGLAGREGEMRLTLDRAAEALRAGAGKFEPGASEKISDLRLQLAAARQQAAWYDAEWQKSRHRAEDARRKLVAKRQELERLKHRISSNDNN